MAAPPELPPDIVARMGASPVAALLPSQVRLPDVPATALAGLYFFDDRRVLLVASRKPEPPAERIWELSPRFVTATTGGVRIGDGDQFALVGDAYSTVNTLRQLMGIAETSSAASVVPQVADQDRWQVPTTGPFSRGVRLSIADDGSSLVAQLANDEELRWSFAGSAVVFHPASPGTPTNVVVDQPVLVGETLVHGIGFPVPDLVFANSLAAAMKANPCELQRTELSPRRAIAVRVLGEVDGHTLSRDCLGWLIARGARLYLVADGLVGHVAHRGDELPVATRDAQVIWVDGPLARFGLQAAKSEEVEEIAGFAAIAGALERGRGLVLGRVRTGSHDEDVGIVGRVSITADGSLNGPDKARSTGAAAIERVRVAGKGLHIEVAGGSLDVLTTSGGARSLADAIWAARSDLEPQVFPEEYVHRDLEEHAREARTYDRWLNREAVLRFYEEQVEPMALPDLKGKAVRATPRQLPKLFARVAEISDVLGIEPPEVYVFAMLSISVDAEGFRRPRLEVSRRALKELEPAELEHMLARELAHVALGHLEDEVYGEQLLKLIGPALAVLEDTGASAAGVAGRVAGATVGSIVPIFGTALGAGLGGLAASYGSKLFARELGLFDRRGEMMLAKLKLARWFRTATLSADAFAALWTGDVAASLRSILIGILVERDLVEAIHMPEYLAEMEDILAIEGPVAVYTRLDEVLPYGQERVASLLGYLATARGRAAWAKTRRIHAHRGRR